MRFRYISSRAPLWLRAHRAVAGLAGAISALTLGGGIVTAAPASAALNAPVNGGYYYLENLDAGTSGCLDANLNTLPANVTRVQTWQCNGWANQTWITTVHHTTDNSWYTIQNSDGDQCLDANANTLPANGTTVQVWDCNSWGNQEWILIPIS